jgi:hypothetical protein
MNWIRENKFLTGFIAILVIGAGALGYLLYSAYDTYSDVSDQYTETSTELNKLQAQDPYPDAANLAKFRAEHDQLLDATHTLATSLSQMVLPVENLTPSAFQDRLRTTLTTVVAKAGTAGVKLPTDFALDFNQYQTLQPAPAAAGPLGRQLAAVEIIMNILIDDHVESITALTRTKLPQEGGPGGVRRRLVDTYPFDIQFVSTQQSFQKVLNDVAASTTQFFITRTLLVDNSDPKPVAKVAETPPPAPAAAAGAGPGPGAAAAAAPDTSGTNDRLAFVVGTEKLDVAMRIDMVTFNAPENSTRRGAGPNR